MKSALIICLILLSSPSFSQSIFGVGVGATYEIRDQDPTNGFGIRLEKNALNLILVNLRTRANFSMFSGDSRITAAGIEYDNKVEGWDLSGAVTAGLGLGLFGPYVGLGAGVEQVNTESSFISGDGKEFSTFTYGILGVEMTILPFVKPFLEYRYNAFLEDPKNYRQSSSRFMIGVTVRI